MRFDVRLVHNVKSKRVAKLVKFGHIGIVRGSYGVHVKLFHKFKVFKRVVNGDGSAGERIAFVAVYTFKLNMLAVYFKNSLFYGYAFKPYALHYFFAVKRNKQIV